MSRTSAFDLFPFAVKEHKASSLHWDLQVKYSGKSLFSLALEGPPNRDPNRPVQGVRVQDHNFDHLLKEWIIPADRPGAGPTVFWDKGVLGVLKNESLVRQISGGYIILTATGERLKGKYSLIRKGPQEKKWILKKELDEYADRELQFPNTLTPDKIQQLSEKKPKKKDIWTLELFPNFQWS